MGRVKKIRVKSKLEKWKNKIYCQSLDIYHNLDLFKIVNIQLDDKPRNLNRRSYRKPHRSSANHHRIDPSRIYWSQLRKLPRCNHYYYDSICSTDHLHHNPIRAAAHHHNLHLFLPTACYHHLLHLPTTSDLHIHLLLPTASRY